VLAEGAMAPGWIASRSRPIRAKPRLTGGGPPRDPAEPLRPVGKVA
jgi:hypothetical protein